MKRQLYDLAAGDETIRFSPYCWRIKLALAHKNLSFETIPWHFTEKEVIAFSGQTKVPVLVDGDTVINDSQAIAEYLEAQYPNEASLFGDPPSRALTRFIKHWAEASLHPALGRILMPNIHAILSPEDKPYFRRTREAMARMTLEEVAGQRETNVKALEVVLRPLRETLDAQPFIAGAAPSYADHIVFGALQWARLTSATPLFGPDDKITLWMESVLAAYGL